MTKVKNKATSIEIEVTARFMKEWSKFITNPNQSIGTYIEKITEKYPLRTALYFEDKTWTWKELNEECNKIANYFLNFGIQKGDCVAVMLENSPEYLFITSGINKIQGISGLININQKKKVLIHSLDIIDPKCLIVDGDCLFSLKEVSADLSINKDQIFVVNNHQKIQHDFIDLSSELNSISTKNPDTTFNSVLRETALYIFTSGTTGFPKAVVMENRRLYQSCYLIAIALAQITEEDIIYIPTPLYHSVGYTISYTAATIKGAAVVLKKRFSASEFWKDIQRYKITYMSYVGEIPRYLLNQPVSKDEKNHTLRRIAGIGLRKSVWESFQKRFGIEHIYEYYASTEAHRSFTNYDEIPGMVGRYSNQGLELVKVNPETGELYRNDEGYCFKCQPGDVGLALVSLESKTEFTGYKDPEKTNKKLLYDVFKKNDIYFNTGDFLEVHENWFISFLDRGGDTFRWKSENVSTLEVESILNSYDAVQLSAVYGVQIPNTEGKAGMASIKLNPAFIFDLNRFSKFLLDVLPKYAIPVFLRICEDIQVTGSFKIKKVKLRNEAYNIEIIKDDLYMWNSLKNQYISLTQDMYQELMNGKFGVTKLF